MPKNITVTYSFEKQSQILDKDSEELKAYIALFDEQILPEMIDVERRKNKAIEEAYKIRIC